uniref:Ovule protein n=1 Tax=Caenorhabditis tropicalis TaxID=1561998 RepID=A0A1I7TX88_9PELO
MDLSSTRSLPIHLPLSLLTNISDTSTSFVSPSATSSSSFLSPSPSSAFRPVIPKNVVHQTSVPSIDTYYMTAIQSLVAATTNDDQYSELGPLEVINLK